MKADQSFFADGAALRLGERLGKGGEGEVFALADEPSRAAKIYHTERASERARKVAAMVRSPLAEGALVAAPLAVVTDGTGAFRGFVMPRIAGAAALHDLYGPASRRKLFPHADYRFVLRVAANAARAVAAVHTAGHVIGDVNHSGFLVSDDGLVALIDADSFQVAADGTVYRCTVGVPEYTPPELQGISLGDVDRTVQHDAFGLAVAIFQLLFFGRHPFAGVSEGERITIPEAIAVGAFAFSAVRSGPLGPPPGALALSDLSAPLAALFERAFGPDPADRPNPQAWIEGLRDAEAALRPCLGAVRHDYDLRNGACPLCRMEGDGASPLFPWRPPDMALADIAPPKVADGALDAARETLNALSPPDTLTLQLPPPTLPQDYKPPERSRWPEVMRIVGGVVSIGLSATNGIMIPNNWLLSVPGLIAGAALIRSALRRDRAAQQDLLGIDSGLSRRLLDIQARADFDSAALAHAKASALVEARAKLPDTWQASTGARLEARVVEARQERMRATPVAALGLLDDDVASLQGAGVQTAADLLSAPPSTLPLSSKTHRAAMAACRAALDAMPLGTVIADALADAAADDTAALAEEAQRLDDALAAELRELKRRMHTVELALQIADPDILAKLAEREKFVREIELVGGTPPEPPLPAPRHLRAETRRRIREITHDAARE